MRWCVLVVVAGAVAPMAIIGALAAGASVLVSAVAAALLSILAIPLIVRFGPQGGGGGGGGDGRRRLFVIAWVMFSLLATYRVTMLGTYMLDVSKTENAINPTLRPLGDAVFAKPFFVQHNCFTCYVLGARYASDGVDNIYDAKLYRDPQQKTDIHRTIGDALTIDRYQYPPPFLILPRALMAVTSNFFQMRTYWFVLNVVLFGAAVWMLAHWIGDGRFHAYWFVWPLVLIAPNTLGTLQVGNTHFLIITMAMLGMLALETRRYAFGGLLLGFAIVSKLFPGLLLVYLIVRRRWSAVLWTCGAMVAICVATLLVFGVKPFDAFVGFQLGRLFSGEAFNFAWTNPRAIAVNSSVMGAAFKLQKLGVLGNLDALTMSKVYVWCHTVMLGVVIVIAGLRDRRPATTSPSPECLDQRRVLLAQTWIALLVLGQLRSPFLPWGYGSVAVLWLIASFAPNNRGGWWRWLLIAPASLMFAVPIPLPVGPASISFDDCFSLAALVVTILVCLVVTLRIRHISAPSPI